MRILGSGEFFGETDRLFQVTEGLSVGVVRHDRHLTLPRHRHELARICVILSGSMSESHGSGFEEFSSDWILFWPPGVIHEDQFGSSLNRTLQIEFTHSFYVDKIASYFPKNSPSPVRTGALEDAVPHLCTELLRSEKPIPLAIEGAIYELIARACRLRRTAMPHSFQVQQAISFIDLHLAEGVRPSDLSAAVGAPRAKLNRLFQAELGCSLTHWIRMRRLQSAQAMLRGTRKSIGEVAAHFGYFDSAHMTRDFRRFIGATPTSFRRAVQSETLRSTANRVTTNPP